jgi:hypothetical protein
MRSHPHSLSDENIANGVMPNLADEWQWPSPNEKQRPAPNENLRRRRIPRKFSHKNFPFFALCRQKTEEKIRSEQESQIDLKTLRKTDV